MNIDNIASKIYNCFSSDDERKDIEHIKKVLQRELGAGVPGVVSATEKQALDLCGRLGLGFVTDEAVDEINEWLSTLLATVRAPLLVWDDNYGYTPFGWSYEVCELWADKKTGYWITYSEGNDLNPFGDKHPTEEKAKEACQVDYNRRIVKAFARKEGDVKC